jgi:hypothetical protein
MELALLSLKVTGNLRPLDVTSPGGRPAGAGLVCGSAGGGWHRWGSERRHGHLELSCRRGLLCYKSTWAASSIYRYFG